MLDVLTLDQLRVLTAIAETGSFTAAARRLNRTQSAISHAVTTLEGELRLPLFDRSERKPRLTDAGRAILADARLALARIDQLKVRARGFAWPIQAWGSNSSSRRSAAPRCSCMSASAKSGCPAHPAFGSSPRAISSRYL